MANKVLKRFAQRGARCNNVWLLTLSLISVFLFRTTLFAQDEIVYELVKSKEQLIDGGTYIIVNMNSQYALGWQDTNNRKGVSISGKVDGDYIKGLQVATNVKDHTGVYELTLYKYNSALTQDRWTFYDNVNGQYLCAHSSRDQNGLLLKSAYSSESAATIDFTGSGVLITFLKHGKNSTKLEMGTSAKVFACYENGSTLALYRRCIGAFSISKWGYTTYTNNQNYVMPRGCTGFVVSLSDYTGTNELLLTERYKSGDVIPQNTPLLIEAAPGEYSLYHNAHEAEPVAGGENLLHGEFDDEGNITYDIEHKEVHEYYKLTTKNGINFGFYWGANDGAPFRMSRTDRAYLVLPCSSHQGGQVKGLVLDEAHVETGVASHAKTVVSSNKTYDLSGRTCYRPLTSGIYIRDGRKVLISR